MCACVHEATYTYYNVVVFLGSVKKTTDPFLNQNEKKNVFIEHRVYIIYTHKHT